MKIPENVRIGGVDYKVIDDWENLNDGINMLSGQIDYNESNIKISSLVNGHQAKCVTLWHEILHGIRNHTGMEIENEEQVVEMFAKGIYQVLQDNARALFDIR